MAARNAMSRRLWTRRTKSAFGRIGAIVLGFVMMIVGLGLGVTMIMLPAGVIIGLLGVAIFIFGLFGQSDVRA